MYTPRTQTSEISISRLRTINDKVYSLLRNVSAIKVQQGTCVLLFLPQLAGIKKQTTCEERVHEVLVDHLRDLCP